ncbi:hypothetical protein [Sediminispirochaeta smaragdinae]|uniref:Uncharacterized protein n=1 Tax=Sediminispirochaeta smaragdinae (strain DSM 11293 / JCM 15392 / SEBR 4228) TaxID=573413 RepID=E1R6V5_SEDSS|nr:hypothetical protein [Sediminispirochaeta smaragdinae]ADK81282.1 hypothetical protein Spirs_2162 [Sediminispirochaeta smaragdinae DSM 11293]
MEIIDILNKTVSAIDAIKNTLPISATLYEQLHNNLLIEYNRFLETKCEKISDKEKGEGYRIPESQFTRFIRIKEKISKLEISLNIAPRNYIISLISQFDFYIGNLIRYVLNKQPEILNTSDRKLTFADIKKFDSIEKAITYLIEKEVDSVIRCSHDDHLKWFEKKLNINLRSDKKLIEEFIEITERRNLFTHCDGSVNESYLEKVGRNSDTIVVGSKLSVSPEYFQHSCDVIFLIVVYLGHIVWNILDPDDSIKKNLNTIAYEQIQEENYNIAENILNFALNSFGKIRILALDTMLKINLSQTYLWQERDEESKKILSEIDWSLCTEEYLIAKAVIERDFRTAIRMIKEDNNKRKVIGKNELIEWPLFKELRKTEEFKEYFKKQYGENAIVQKRQNIDTEVKISTML